MNGRWEIIVEEYFSSAHSLRGYDGACERLHGHNWRVEVSVTGNTLDDTGLLVDFRILKKLLRSMLGELDHRYLNEHHYFAEVNPSAENIAVFMAERMAESLPENVRVSWVRVWEGRATRAVYFPGEA